MKAFIILLLSPLALAAREVRLSNTTGEAVLVHFNIGSSSTNEAVTLRAGESVKVAVDDDCTLVALYSVRWTMGTFPATTFVAGDPLYTEITPGTHGLVFDVRMLSTGSPRLNAYVVGEGAFGSPPSIGSLEFAEDTQTQLEVFLKAFAVGVVVGLASFTIQIFMKVGQSID